jgi:hypothetical protein
MREWIVEHRGGCIFAAIAIIAGLLSAYYGFWGDWGVNRHLPEPQFAEGRDLDYAKKEFRHNIKAVQAMRNSGKIGDAEYNAAHASELAILDDRINSSKDPIRHVCQASVDVSGNIRTYDLPAVCDESLKLPVWFTEAPNGIIRAEWVTEHGHLYSGTPQLHAGFGSTAKPLGGNRWEVYGSVVYWHEHADDHIKLRITVE